MYTEIERRDSGPIDRTSEAFFPRESAGRYAEWAVTGGHADDTATLFGEFIAGIDGQRLPVSTKSKHLSGPISTPELLGLMFGEKTPEALRAAATKELAARYLDDPYTRKVIERISLEA